MRLLADTHAFLWFITEAHRLTAKALEAFVSPSNELYLSAASVWEIVTKVQTGKLNLPTPLIYFLNAQLSENRISILPILLSHAYKLGEVPLRHRDPFDRILIAQSLDEQLPIISGDRQFSGYPIEVIW